MGRAAAGAMTPVGLRPPSVMAPATRLSHPDCRATSILIVAPQAKERLGFHQAQSKPRMQTLKEWLDSQIEERKVEPNSSLGEAFQYRWVSR